MSVELTQSQKEIVQMIVPFKDFGCAIVNDSGSKSFLIVEYDRHIMDVFIVDVKGLEKKKRHSRNTLCPIHKKLRKQP